jgi:hypothetical protein
VADTAVEVTVSGEGVTSVEGAASATSAEGVVSIGVSAASREVGAEGATRVGQASNASFQVQSKRRGAAWSERMTGMLQGHD